MRKKFVILMVLFAVMFTGCNENSPDSEQETPVTTETIAEVTTTVTTAKTTVTEETLPAETTAVVLNEWQAKNKAIYDSYADEYIKALKEKNFTTYFGRGFRNIMEHDEAAKTAYLRYMDEFTIADIERSEGRAVFDENDINDLRYVEYDITMTVSKSNNMRFPVGESRWTMIAGPAEDCVITIYPKGREFNNVTYSTASQPEEVLMCYYFSRDFDMYTDCENLSELYSVYENRTDEFYDKMLWYIWANEIEVDSDEAFYNGAEQLLGITGLDLSDYSRYEDRAGETLYPPHRGGVWKYCTLYEYKSVADGYTEIVIDYFADGSYLVPAKRILYTLENTEYSHRLVSMKVLEDTGCYIAGGNT